MRQLSGRLCIFLSEPHRRLQLALLSLIFLAGLWFRLSVPWLPLFDPDSWGYLNPALSEIGGSGFQQTHGRSIAYPLFLLSVLKISGDFYTIPLMQHIAGLLSGLFWWGSWILWTRWLPANLRESFWVHCCALLFLFLFLCNSSAIFYETTIRPEAIFPLLALVQVWLCLAYARSRWADGQNVLASVTGALAMLSALLCLSVKPSWGFAAGVPFVLVIAGIFGRSFRARFVARAAPFIFGSVLCFVWLKAVPPAVGWIPDQTAKSFLPATLFTVHAPILAEVIRQRVEKGASLPGESDFLQNLDRRIAESRNQEKESYPVLGHDADYLMYHSDTLAKLPLEAGSASGREYMFGVYGEALLGFPSYMLDKALRQLQTACSNLAKTVYRPHINWISAVRTSSEAMDYYTLPANVPNMTGSFARVRAGHEKQMQNAPERLYLGPGLNEFFARKLGPLFLGCWLFAWPFLAVWAALRHGCFEKSFMGSLVFMGIMWASLVGSMTTVALVHSFDIGRYLHLLSAQQSLFLATSLALTAGFVFNLFRPRSQDHNFPEISATR